MAIRLNNAMRSAIVNSGIVGFLGTSGIVKVYDGVQAANGGDAATGNCLVQINAVAWNTGTNGTALITGTKTGTAGTAGTATWARLSGTDGTTYIIDGNCGTAATCDFVIDAAPIALSSVVSLTAATIVQPAA
jgi:hypothetical protein